MASKTISVSEAAYERLQENRRGPDDSFSRIILRARWDGQPWTAGDLLAQRLGKAPYFAESDLRAIEEARKADHPPADKWKNP